MRIGIFFGGPSREREISFAGGKTAFEYIDKSLFTPVPFFVDGFGRFIKLEPSYMYASGIRDFYPAPASQTGGYALYAESYPELADQPVSAEIGEWIQPHDLTKHIDFAFLAMHGPDCEDGAIQGLLEWYRIPYSGPGIMGSSVGIDKTRQNQLIARINGQQKKTFTIRADEWQQQPAAALFEQVKSALGLPIVIKAPHQGSSIGVAIVKEDDLVAFEKGINQCFFQVTVDISHWKSLPLEEKKAYLQQMAEMDKGIGYPLYMNQEVYYHPDTVLTYLNQASTPTVTLLSANAEYEVLLEEFIEGQEFSCGCIQDLDGNSLVLPPTEVIKMVEVFDFDAKYKAGTTRKSIPVRTSLDNNRTIQDYIRTAFEGLGLGVCTRIDGFLTADNKVLLHDPNTIPGMSPSSLIFKQMAEIGLNVTQSITYFIRNSIAERSRTGKNTPKLYQQLQQLDQAIAQQRSLKSKKIGLVIAATQEAFLEAKRKFAMYTSQGYAQVEVLLKTVSGLVVLPLPLVMKDTIEEVQAHLEEPRNQLLIETSERALELSSFLGGKSLLTVSQVADTTAFEEIITIGL